MTALKATTWPASVEATSTITRVERREQWEKLASEFQDLNYRQTWTYAQMSADGQDAGLERLAIRRGNDVIGLAQVRVKTIPFIKTGIAYLSGGPLTRKSESNDIDLLALSLAALREEYVERRGYTLRILPAMHAPGQFDAVVECYRAQHFQPSPWPPVYRTVIVDISRPEAEIRKRLLQKWRNCLNNSERQNMTIRSGSEPELFKQFEELFYQFLDRKQIAVDRGADFYTGVRGNASHDEGYAVSLAMLDGKPIAGQLVSMLGDTCICILGATGEMALKNKAAYLLQWHVMTTAKKRGMRWYDPGGVDPEGNPGVYHFKTGLGGTETASPGPFQATPSDIRGFFAPTVEKLYRWSRGKRKSSK